MSGMHRHPKERRKARRVPIELDVQLVGLGTTEGEARALSLSAGGGDAVGPRCFARLGSSETSGKSRRLSGSTAAWRKFAVLPLEVRRRTCWRAVPSAGYSRTPAAMRNSAGRLTLSPWIFSPTVGRWTVRSGSWLQENSSAGQNARFPFQPGAKRSLPRRNGFGRTTGAADWRHRAAGTLC